MSHKSDIQKCPTRVSYKLLREGVLQECPTRVANKSVPQECPARVSHENVLQECPTRVPHKSVLHECPTRVSYKSFLQECPRRVSVIQGVPQECTRVSHKGFRKECAPQDCPTKVSPTRVAKDFSMCFRVRVCIRVRGFFLVSLSPLSTCIIYNIYMYIVFPNA